MESIGGCFKVKFQVIMFKPLSENLSHSEMVGNAYVGVGRYWDQLNRILESRFESEIDRMVTLTLENKRRELLKFKAQDF